MRTFKQLMHCDGCTGRLTFQRNIAGLAAGKAVISTGKMPKRGDPLTQEEIDVIVAWIKAGALDN